MLRFSGTGVSDVGRVRPQNEDSAFVGPYCALVADGVGGAAAGEVASATAAYVVAATALARFGAPPQVLLRESVASARHALQRGVREDQEREGMATTLTCLMTDGDRVALGHLGDSRAYLFRHGSLTQLSRDHTYVQQLVDSGDLSPAQVPTHPWRNVVLRLLDSARHEELEAGLDRVDGVNEVATHDLVADLEPDVTLLDVVEGDRLLLCSDGLSDVVPAVRIAEVLALADPESTSAVLVQAALEAGARDNVTCVVVDLVDGPLVVGDGRLLGAMVDFRNIVDPASVRAVAGVTLRRMKDVKRPALEGNVAVRGRRRMSFAEYGSPRGPAIIWMHGTPGARRQIPLEARAYVEEHGLRIIGIDRPGIGSSTPHLYPNILDWTRDLEILLDALAVDTLRLIGLSGGGPYVLAAGAALPERVHGVGVLGGVAPTVGPDAADGGPIQLAAHLAPLLRVGRVPLGIALTQAIRLARPVAGRALDLYAAVQPVGDKNLLARPEFKAMFIDDLLNGSRFQTTAPIHDLILFTRDWGFRAENVTVPVRWWHGDADHIVPFRHGQHMVDRLPDATMTVIDGESHLGGLGIAEQVITTLMDLGPRRSTSAVEG